ncbi:11232_t:CDS:2 [Ambispora gerdemannii]|uniref:11232_t:CDS:1 n=1 Tax=Ambispora gerdemannii TaxID=144530 RepID=A0A9N9FHJ2_9GLOM|nr:11232_t:CDS:2 [Ambispora gerdemannii]
MQFQAQNLKRKLDTEDESRKNTYMHKRHNHLSDMINVVAFNHSIQSNISTPTTEDEMDIDLPLFINSSSTATFNSNPNQFHHHQTEVIPAIMLSAMKSQTPSSSVCCVKNLQHEKLIRFGCIFLF